MSAREELSDIILDCGEYIPGSHADDYVNPYKAADAILAAGFRKPPRIKRLEELEALPAESAVQTSDPSDTVVLKGEDGLFRNSFGGEVSAETLWSFGTKPFTVIYEPGAA